MSGEPGWRTYLLALGLIAVIAAVSIAIFGSANSQILSTVSPPV